MGELAKDYLAGVAGGVSVVLIGHPFDTVKTRLQTSPSGVYNGTIDCVRKTFLQEGAKGFYSGIGVFIYPIYQYLSLLVVRWLIYPVKHTFMHAQWTVFSLI